MDNVLLKKKKLLLHACCAPCATKPLHDLTNEFDVWVFFSNSNIDTLDEFNKRLDNFNILKKHYNFNLIVDDYEPKSWSKLCEKYKDEPEKGLRCNTCIAFRLERSFLFAKNNNIGIVSSTLTSSPYKSAKMVFENAEKLSDEFRVFLKNDFKKKDGYKNIMCLSRTYNLYIQNYCGCVYSLYSRSVKV